MEVLMLTVLASGCLVLGALLFFAWNVGNRSHEHSDRLALLPLRDDDADPSDHETQPLSNQAPTESQG